ncbi:putative MFS family arabinose efflux permease [Neorhizobium huautlense]|uniref:MFS family arabinose efflux permease n=1 Tax=Neorhizobium huautlense TaxID=67774 RepID=A0ABT9Q1N0_9HYPH|nr:MFS transporter [Neorhizobium huautlense]MDP9840592.1 putative MFS family arabinose efflux permease [Neorhizobium huautlense]
MMRHANMVGAAFALTALTYGLTRFAYGLLLPSIRAELSLSATAAGWIGGLAFASYCVGVVLAFTLVDRFGERWITVLAGTAATGAMAIIVVSWSGWGLGFAMTLGGLSTGLTSPPLASAVARTLSHPDQVKANGFINSGTAVGIVISGAAALVFSDSWRGLYVAFAGVGVMTTLWLWRTMPPRDTKVVVEKLHWNDVQTSGAVNLLSSSFMVGFASTAVWTFGADIMRDEVGFSGNQIALSWIALGVIGIAGSSTGALVQYLGLPAVHRLAIAMMSLAVVLLAAASAYSPLAFIALGMFGRGYIIATGVLLLWGISIYNRRPALGLSMPFLFVAVGQTAGAPVFGMVLDASGSITALGAFSIVMASGARFTAAKKTPFRECRPYK